MSHRRAGAYPAWSTRAGGPKLSGDCIPFVRLSPAAGRGRWPVNGRWASVLVMTWHRDRADFAVGLTGSDVSDAGGLTWHTFDTGQFGTVSCAPDGSCWASGDLGRAAILQR